MSDFDTPPPPVTVTSSSQSLIARVQAILTKPAPTWDVIAVEPSSIQSIYTGYVVPLAAIGPICRAIGMSFIGVGAFGFSYHTPIVWAIVEAVVSYVLGLVMLYVQALIINWLAPQFDGQKNMLAAFKLAAYSMTAVWIAGIFSIIPMLAWLGIVGLYSIYLFYLGVPKLMKSPPDKTIVYMIVAAVVGCVASIIPAMIAGSIVAMAGVGAMAGAGMHPGAAGMGTFTVNGPNGKATIDVDKMAQAANQMAAAVSAQATAQQTGGTVKVADPQQLLALMPANYMGAARSNENASSGGAAGVSASSAEATYTIGDGSITLKIADLGTVAGIGAFAAAMNVNTSSSSGSSYDKVTTVNGVMTEEEYDASDKSGKYSIVTNGRISVEADGTGVDINALKNLVSSIDLNRAQALTK